ncbi:PASTA domain-containing protein [Labrys sp. LIt4]|uniref:PASTA domain-containing protein n=1 Tax=Labrys okinawensis TaxID=346911 RepID=A0A2S9QDS0_9HYPH|nr:MULTISPECIES: PASTA domain-containing protein [Labrys]MBP0580053.1 PASTA domain-containing protein [Labrys sp. LIt4]PRH87494.1 hypothetical protein C5L14_12845 [Labrys okinawensis]
MLGASAAPALAAAMGMGDEPPSTSSEVKGVVFRLLTTLPRAPGPVEGADECSHLTVKPTSEAGRLVADRGWAVTGEAKLGTALRAVSFAGGFEPGTSGTCLVNDGNVGVFDGSKLVALLYAEKGAKATLGRLEALEGGGVRVLDGDYLATPLGDIRSIDDYKFEFNPVAANDSVCGGRAKVPNINNMSIDKARAALRANGWVPVPSSEQDRADSRVADLVKLGVVEAEACSGTGLGYCSYNYRSEAGTLSVTTAGDNDYPSVTDYAVKCN